MRILYLTQYFPPETGAGARRAFEMASVWHAAGHEVLVVCPFPNYPTGKIDARYAGKLRVRESVEGISVLRLPVYATPKKTFANRIGNYFSFAVSAGLAGAVLKSPDVLYVTSPPLPIGLGAILPLWKGARLFFEVRDLWPESAKALGELRDGPLYRFAESFEEWCYRRAERVVTATPGIAQRLIERGVPKHKILVAPNGAHLQRFAVAARTPIPETREQLAVFYGGILGLTYGMPALIEAVRLLRDRREVSLTIAGTGVYHDKMAAAKVKYHLDNLTLLGDVPGEQIPALLAASDTTIIPLRAHPFVQDALPVKLFESWASARPTVLGGAGQVARFVSQHGGGIVVPPEDPRSLAQALLWLARNRQGLAEMGRRGFAAVQGYDRVTVARNILAVMEAST